MIADRYFVVQPDQCRGYKSVLIPDHDVLPLDILPNCKQLAELKDGRVLLHVRLGKIQIESMQKIGELLDPLSLDSVKFLGLSGSYIGRTREEVLTALPELDGTRIVTYTDSETGEEISKEKPLLPKHEWN